MTTEITVPVLPESVTEGTLGAWHKHEGDYVQRDDHLVDLETDKVVLEIVAQTPGRLVKINCHEGEIVTNNQILGVIEEEANTQVDKKPQTSAQSVTPKAGPAARKLMHQHNLNENDIEGTGNKGAITKQDVERYIAQQQTSVKAKVEQSTETNKPDVLPVATVRDQRVPMSRLRRSIATRLKEAQNTAALLTTFNEVDLQPMQELRAKYKATFEATHETKLGMMSFFTKAVIEGLKRFPVMNASIDGTDIVYHDYYDIGIAVSSERGLVVPVLRNAEQLSYAGIEKSIRNLAVKARDGKLSIDDLTGGTFSITNGGVFGSMLSTPIINPPQSAILGMHSITERAVVRNGEIVIRPMMYLAVSYDHRIIDGKDAVQFLTTVKECIEDPAKILLNI